MKIVFLTDLHFNCVYPERKEMFFKEVLQQKPDVVAITGDISVARRIQSDLVLISQKLSVPVYFVAGNHDFYGSGFMEVDELIDFTCHNHPNLHHLGNGEIVELTSEVGLIGHRGWYDGRAGSGSRSPVELNDFHCIKDLIGLSNSDLFNKLEVLGRKSADYFREVLPQALNRYREVFIATHVPPFIEAAWHGESPTESDFLPLFTNVSSGEAIRDVAKQFPDRRIIVLAGHTHSRAYFEEANIECHVGEAVYGEPMIQGVFQVG